VVLLRMSFPGVIRGGRFGRLEVNKGFAKLVYRFSIRGCITVCVGCWRGRRLASRGKHDKAIIGKQ